jgi:hypothetical protein
MNWTNKYNDFRVECIKALQEALKKGYNKEELWNSEEDERYEIPTAPYVGKHMDYETYSLILWDGKSFKGIGWESQDDFWFDVDDLETRTICELIDLINEKDKV